MCINMCYVERYHGLESLVDGAHISNGELNSVFFLVPMLDADWLVSKGPIPLLGAMWVTLR